MDKPNINNWFKRTLNLSNFKENFLQYFDEFQIGAEHKLLPVINGLIGDRLEENQDSRSIKMAFRFNNQDISVDELSQFYDFSKYGGRICILIHGLFGDEYMWKRKEEKSKLRVGDFLEKEQIANVLYLRYNTGLHISENGRMLSNLMDGFLQKYPQISGLNIIAHSMGGLLTRSAGYYADIQRQEWVKKVKKIFLIGVPNQGSYLAQIAELVKEFFQKVDISKDEVISKFLDIRSNGIKDLSYGYLTDDDWLNKSKEKATKNKVRPLPDVDYYLIAGRLGKNKKVDTYFGDGLVGTQSAISNEIDSNVFTRVEKKIFENEDHISLLLSKEVAGYIIANISTHPHPL